MLVIVWEGVLSSAAAAAHSPHQTHKTNKQNKTHQRALHAAVGRAAAALARSLAEAAAPLCGERARHERRVALGKRLLLQAVVLVRRRLVCVFVCGVRARESWR